jgi:hypothetical protein
VADKLRHPWSVNVEPTELDRRDILVSDDARGMIGRLVLVVKDAESTEVATVDHMVRCTNLIGPHLDNPRLIAAVEALARLAADADNLTAFEMACDFLTERAG